MTHAQTWMGCTSPLVSGVSADLIGGIVMVVVLIAIGLGYKAGL